MKGNLRLEDYKELITEATDLESLEERLRSKEVGLTDIGDLGFFLETVWLLSNEQKIREICGASAPKIESTPWFEPDVVKRERTEYRIYGIIHGSRNLDYLSGVRRNICSVVSAMVPGEDFLFEEGFEDENIMPEEHHKLYSSRSFDDHCEGVSLLGVLLYISFKFSPLVLFRKFYRARNRSEEIFSESDFSSLLEDFRTGYEADEESGRQIDLQILQRIRGQRIDKSRIFVDRDISRIFTDGELDTRAELTFFGIKQFAHALLFNGGEHVKLKLLEDYTELPYPIGLLIDHRNSSSREKHQRMTILKSLKYDMIPYSRYRASTERSQYMVDYAIDYAEEHGLKAVNCFVGGGHVREMLYFLEHPDFRLEN